MTIPHIITIGSCKGGVGKSSITALLAIALNDHLRVGVLDADFYGPSILSIFGASQTKKTLTPVSAEGLQILSLQTISPQHTAHAWRAPLLHKTLVFMLQEVHWRSCDVLLIDMPPGTGDTLISLSQMPLPKTHIMVSTPQLLSIQDSLVFSNFCQKNQIPVLGSIINMQGLYKPHSLLSDLLEKHPLIAQLEHQPWIPEHTGSAEFFSTARTSIPVFFQHVQDHVLPYLAQLKEPSS